MKLAATSWLIRLLSLAPLKLLHLLAVPLGWLIYALPWKKHAVVQTNLKLCFPELDRRGRARLHRQHLIELFRLVLEAGVIWHWSRQRIERHLRIEGWEQVIAANDAGRGIMIITGHLGNWELLNLYVSMHLPLVVLYRAPEDTVLDRFITRPRERFGGRMIAGGSPSLRHLLTQLKSGKAAGIAADIQPKRGEGIFVPLFGHQAMTMTLANKLARRSNPAVFLAWAERRPRGRGWTLHFEPADDSIADDDALAAMTPVSLWLESAIRKAPPQYLWIYKRFSRRPEGEARLYKKK
jgi:KDO2-lipid IV(A) lauroyltransferase